MTGICLDLGSQTVIIGVCSFNIERALYSQIENPDNGVYHTYMLTLIYTNIYIYAS